MNRPTGGLLGKGLELLESKTGLTVESKEKLGYMEEAVVELGAQTRMLDLLGWTVLDHFTGREHEVKYESRKVMARRATHAWIHDPLVGGAVALMNDFVLGRGIPKPRCADDEVQEIVDEAWDDPDNRRALTEFTEQIALVTDLSLYSNLMFLLFDEGEDGKVKVSTLDYLTVSEAVTDPENRHRVLYYVAKEAKAKWDFKEHKWQIPVMGSPERFKTIYYEHWHNVKDAEDEEDREEPLEKPKDSDLGKGRVFHVRINRTKEMIFGIPEWQRTLRWATAYNDFMKSRVDMMKAAAAFVMERRVKGTPNQVAKLAAKAVSRTSPLSGTSFPIDPDSPADGGLLQPGPRPASVITSNEGVTHEPLRLDSGAGNAQIDASNLRSQFSASTRWPQHYLGAGDGPGLATATAMELPVLKMIETRQEVIESIYRWFIDRVIERAVESGKVSEEIEPEPAERREERGEQRQERRARTLEQHLEEAQETGRQFVTLGRMPSGKRDRRWLLVTRDTATFTDYYRVIVEAHEDKAADEEDTQRDLSYEFGLPSPLKRMMSDLVSSIASIARTFDPNNTNLDLSRTLLYVALGEGLEMENAGEVVNDIFPEGYVDPAIAAAQAQARMEGGPEQQQNGNIFGPENTGKPFPSGPGGNPYSAPMNASWPEEQALIEGRLSELPENMRTIVRERLAHDDDAWEEVVTTAREELAVLTTAGRENGGTQTE